MSAQSLEALQRANANRMAAGEVRREVGCGLLPIYAALVDPRAGCMDIRRLLCAQRSWGPLKADTLLAGLGIHPTRKVRDLTDRQRNAIIEGTPSMSGAPTDWAVTGRIEFMAADAEAVSEALRAALVALHQGVEPNLLWAPTYRLALIVQDRA